MTVLSDLINQEIASFKGQINISETSTFDHYDTIQKINNYRNNKFHSNSDADDIFWNLAKARMPYFLKKLRLKQKNFKMYAKGDNNFYQGWIANMRFQKWARESGFTLDLEDLKENVAIYGTVVMKLISKEDARTLDDEKISKFNLEPVFFTNLFYDTSTPDIINSTVIEYHEMTELQLRSKQGIWDESGPNTIQKALEQAKIVQGTSADNVLTKYIIYERWGEYKDDMNDIEEKVKYRQYFVCGEGDKEVKLYKKDANKKKDFPYIDFHLNAYQGRHLRVGVYERLFELFKRINRLINENAQASAIASLLLMSSSEEDLVGVNLLDQSVSGQIVDTKDLKQIGITNNDFNAFASELSIIDRQADLLCMTPEVSTGNLPADATVRGQILSANEITSAFETSVDRIGFKVSKVLLEKIIPSQVAGWNKEDIVEIAEYEIDIRIYDFKFATSKLNEWLEDQFEKGNNPTPEQQKAWVDRMITRLNVEGRKVTNMKGFFDFEFGFYMNPTGYNENKERKNETSTNAINMILSNPNVTKLPIFRQLLEDNNITPFRLTDEEIAELLTTSEGGAKVAQAKSDELLSQVKE